MPELKTAIVGTRFRGPEAINALRLIRKGDAIELRAEPDNQHDPNAVACYAGDCHIGYVPPGSNKALATAMSHDSAELCSRRT
jgi:hypothetical protein